MSSTFSMSDRNARTGCGPDWIPEGELTVIEGRKATGKSTVASDKPPESWPVWICQMGPPAVRETSVTRRGVTGVARCDVGSTANSRSTASPWYGQFIVLDYIEADDGGQRLYEIPGDLDLIEEKVREHHIELLVVDVLDNFLGDHVDAHSNHSVRRAPRPLAWMAQKLGITIMAIRHLRKGQEGRPPTRAWAAWASGSGPQRHPG